MSSNDYLEVLDMLKVHVKEKYEILTSGDATKIIKCMEKMADENLELDELRVRQVDELEQIIVGILSEVGVACSGPVIRKARKNYL